MERKTLKFELKALDEETGIFEGYASVFSKTPDTYGDVVEPGAFTKTLAEGGRRVKVLWNHSVMEPIGKPLEMKEDAHGLWVKGKLSLGVQRAREVLALMKDDVINELSIGYDAIIAPMQQGVRHLKEVRLWDFSPVTFAAEPGAIILAVKEENMDTKSGRVLSAANMGKVQAAFDALQALLEIAAGDDEEPGKSTPPLDEKSLEAAELDVLLAQMEAEVKGSARADAVARIDDLIRKMEVVNA